MKKFGFNQGGYEGAADPKKFVSHGEKGSSVYTVSRVVYIHSCSSSEIFFGYSRCTEAAADQVYNNNGS
jgi:hypothetical protein